MSGPRFCYVVMCHADEDVVLRLVSRIRAMSPGAGILIRHDQEGFITEDGARAAGAALLRSRSTIVWGGWAMTAAEMEAFTRAREAFHPDWYVLISGQDYPIRDLAVWEQEVVASRADALVDPMQEPLYRPRYTFRWSRPFRAPRWVPLRLEDAVAAALERLLRPVDRFVRCSRNPRDRRWSLGLRRPGLLLGRRPPVPVTKGAQWMTISDRALTRFLDRHRSEPALRRFFMTTQLADEMYVQSVLRDASDLVVLDRPTSYARFVGSSPSPVWLDLAELRTASTSAAAFARKFAPGADDVRSAADRLCAVSAPVPVPDPR